MYAASRAKLLVQLELDVKVGCKRGEALDIRSLRTL